MHSDVIRLGYVIPGYMDWTVEFLSVVVSAVSLFKRVAESVEVSWISSVDFAAENFKILLLKFYLFINVQVT